MPAPQVARLAKKLPTGDQAAMAAQLSSADGADGIGDDEELDPDDLT